MTALLEVPGTARAVGLGGAYAAVVGDEGSVFVNPAGLAPIRRVAIGASYERAEAGVTLSTGAAALRVGKFHVALGLVYRDFGSDSAIVPQGAAAAGRAAAAADLEKAYDMLAVGALAYRRGLLSVGGSVKYLRERVGTDQPSGFVASGVGLDAGAAAAFFDIAALGIVMQNIGGGDLRTSSQKLEPLPRATRVGFTLNIIDPQGARRLLVTTEWIAPRGGDTYWAFGLEGGIVSRGFGVLGRAGVTSGRAESDRRPLVLGGGIVVRSFRLDYGYRDSEAEGGPTHRFGVRWAR
ncbi:MAG: hypothetical protein HY705_02270 [Gemmatimonadetes bacterium]|nr:hypothetical protein [Gemmatimonadota bacterium]